MPSRKHDTTPVVCTKARIGMALGDGCPEVGFAEVSTPFSISRDISAKPVSGQSINFDSAVATRALIKINRNSQTNGGVKKLLNDPQGLVAKISAGSLPDSRRLQAIHTPSATMAMVGIT
jgi:hypothetical protein